MITNQRLRALQQTRRHGVGRLLLLVRRDFLVRLNVMMEQRVGHAVLHASAALLPFIDLEGTRSTELARRLGVSKQAVGKIIKALEEQGFLTRSVDDADRRAFLVSFTETGVDYLIEMHAAIRQIERQYEAMVGPGQIEKVRAALSAIAYADDPVGDDGGDEAV